MEAIQSGSRQRPETQPIDLQRPHSSPTQHRGADPAGELQLREPPALRTEQLRAAPGARLRFDRRVYAELREERGALLRGLGFASAPLLLLALQALPMEALRRPIWLLAHTAAIASFTLAAREALAVRTTTALLVCLFALTPGLRLGSPELGYSSRLRPSSGNAGH
jgi:hypothetical protein